MRRKLLFVRLLFSCCLLFSATAYAQNETVTGQVKDDAGAPLQGAVVSVKGSRTAVTTNTNGMFTVKASQGATLVISHVGYADIEVKADGSMLSIAMSRQARQLDEIIVTALGIKKEKKALSYSVTEVKGSDLTESRSVNVANSLEGKVAGLNITSTATGASGSARITLRGNGSISGNNQPLLVVDGIPIDNTQMNFATGSNNNAVSSVGMWAGTDQGDGISSLNPDEIETISVLKGGTAAALYGSRASNGAILVTTKSGKKGVASIEFSGNGVLESLEYKKFKDYQYQYGIGDLGVAPTTSNPTSQTDSYGSLLDGHPVIQYDGVSRPYSAVKNNLSDFYNTGTAMTSTAAISGGNEKTVWRLSGSNLNYHGIMPWNYLVRDNFAASINSEVTKRLILEMNAKYIAEKTHDRPILSDSPGNADYTLYTMPTSLAVSTMKANQINAQGYEIPFSGNVYVTNPYFATQKFKEDDNKQRLITSFTPRFNITDWLYVKGQFGFDRYNYSITSIIPTGAAFQPGGGYVHDLVSYTQTNNGLFLGIDKKFGDKFALTGFVGGNKESISQIGDLSNDGTNPFNIPFFYNVANITPANLTVSHPDLEDRVNSVFASADLSYKNYLFLNLTGRNDWFSALTPATGSVGKLNNHIFYPSIGLSWVVSEALRMPAFINYAKVRASWAEVGGEPSPYQLSLNYSLTGANNGAPLAQVNGSQIPNSGLLPYSSLSDEIGIETRMVNNRMGFELTYYNHNISKDIISATVAPVSGYQSAVFNIGKATNKGIEASISYRVIENKSFTWEPAINFSYNKSNIAQLYGTLKQITLDNARTQTVNVVDEIGKPASEVQTIAYQRNSAGQIEYNSQGLPMIAAGYKDQGTGISPVVTGLTNAFRYKRLTLDILVDAKFGGVIYSGTNALAYRYGLSKGTLPGRESGVVGVGVGPDGKTANAVNVNATTYYQDLYGFGEPFIYSSDFIKLRSATLDYSIPMKGWGPKNPLKVLTVSLVGRNLWTIVKHTPNIDPESTYNNGNAQGLEFAGFPITRTFGLNINAKF